MEHFIVTQTKNNESLGESVNLLTSRLDVMAAHQKTMDAQIAQIAQQVSHLSRPQGHLPSQPETKPRGHVNGMPMMGERLEESPVMVLQGAVSIPDSVGTEGKKRKESLSSVGETGPSTFARSYRPSVPFP